MSKVFAVDFGNIVLVQVKPTVIASQSTSSDVISYLSSSFGKPAYLVGESAGRYKYRGSNQSTLNQLSRINPQTLRWSEYRIG
ncbi:hypothetical protein NV379_02080 [Paenibacillus sp. N1-5-1-14]|uniref:hypothetical protein n=1 Tax=Paenibacillus radicibacter TaxID=2972488 RepID=UPI00215908A9|nr:hypothetical protein [Paenibacillus radicibacter]MCR8641434.1 hypothetical protein [Paenibacillus radicibacter]